MGFGFTRALFIAWNDIFDSIAMIVMSCLRAVYLKLSHCEPGNSFQLSVHSSQHDDDSKDTSSRDTFDVASLSSL